MTYNKETANQIAGIHNIPASTLTTWKSRGKIPRKYFNEDGSIKASELFELAERQETQRAKKVLETWELNTAALASIEITRSADIIRGKAALKKAEYIALKKEITDLKNRIRRLLEEKAHDSIVRTATMLYHSEKRVKWHSITSKHIADALSHKQDLQIHDAQQFQIDVGLFLQSLNI